MLYYVSPAGHLVYRKSNNIIIDFCETMNCYSTSQLNGGIQKIKSCFNHELKTWIKTTNDLPQGSIEEYFKSVAHKLNLDYPQTTGLMTTASMNNASLIASSYRDISLFTLITAGAAVNALRAGDPASYYENSFNNFQPLIGTINIMLIIDAFLPLETLARVPIIVTEAKTAALQDLAIQSCLTSGIATGTGTDGLIIACAEEHKIKFSDCGNHSRLGHEISRIILQGVKASLIKERLDYAYQK